MSREQRARFLPAFMDDDRYHLAFAAAKPDPDVAWKYHRSVARPMQCAFTAIQCDGGWNVHGTTPFVPNASIAKLFVVQAKVVGSDCVVTLLVPADRGGVRVNDGPDGPETVKWYHGAGGELALDDCSVPERDVIGDDRAAALSPLAASDPQICAMNIGVGRAAFEAAVDYAKLRVQGGRPIIQHQAIGTLLAEAAASLSVARDAVWHAAWALDHTDEQSDCSGFGLPLDTIAHVFTSEAVYKATEHSAECFGAMGVMLDMPLPKYLRDARLFLHSGDSSAVARFRIAEALAGFDRG